MPRPSGLIALGLCLLGSASWAADPVACPRDIDLSRPDSIHLRARVSAPCDAYERVRISYGPLTVTEELSNRGEVEIDLPALSNGREVVALLDGAELRTDVPATETPPPAFVAIAWPGAPGFAVAPPGGAATAQTLGFVPGDRSPRLVVTYLENDTALSRLPIRASPEQCGKQVTATLITSDHLEPRDLSLTLPPCGPEGLALQLPLSGTN